MLCAAPQEVSGQELKSANVIGSLCLIFFFLTIKIPFASNHTQEVQKYKLGNPRTFHYLNQTNCYELDGVDDAKEYIATRKAMDTVGISVQEQV